MAGAFEEFSFHEMQSCFGSKTVCCSLLHTEPTESPVKPIIGGISLLREYSPAAGTCPSVCSFLQHLLVKLPQEAERCVCDWKGNGRQDGLHGIHITVG